MQLRTSGAAFAVINLASAQMEVFIQEVAGQVDVRADHNMRHARRVAGKLRALADSGAEIMDLDYDEVYGGPGFARFRRSMLNLVGCVESMMPFYRGFLAEHGPLVDADTRERLERYFDWVRAQPSALGPYWDRFLTEIDAGLQRTEAEYAAVNEEWSDVIADRLADDDAG